MKKDSGSSRAKKVQSKFTPLHFLPQKLNNQENQYVLLGTDQSNKLMAKRLTHQEAVAFVQGDHPDKRVPVDDNPTHDIVYIWNDALNEYVPQG